MTDISCQTGDELLMDYLEGVVPEDLRRCSTRTWPDVRSVRPSWPRMWQRLRILREVTRAAMPEELQQSLLDFLRAQRRRTNQKD